MAVYAVQFAKSASKELSRLDAPLVKRIVAKTEALALDPRPPGCKKLSGSANDWRIRIGDYRVIYSIDDGAKIVDVSTVRHRSDAYQ